MAVPLSNNPLDYPGFTGQCFPEVFTTMPPQPTEKKPGQLPPEQVKEYYEQGFTVSEGFFTEDEIAAVIKSFGDIVEEVTQRLYKAGKIKNLYSELGFQERLIMVEKEFPGAAMLVIKLGKLTPAFRELYKHEKLLNAMEQLIGPEIGASPIWNTRPKIPKHEETDVPFHQDSAYFDLESQEVLIVTAWIAFVDVTEQNGCLEFVKSGHKKGMVVVHKLRETFYLEIDKEELVERLGINPETDFVKCPVKAGGVVFFSNIIPHRSVPNVSDKIRWGMDFRYQSPSAPWGFWDTLSGILLRSPSKPDYTPNFDYLGKQDRYDVFMEEDMGENSKMFDYLGKQDRYDVFMEEEMGENSKMGKKATDEFDTTMTGPFMDKWPLVSYNRHTEAYFKELAAKKSETEQANK